MKQYELMFETFEEATNVQKQLFEIVREKGHVSCADLFNLVHLNEEDRDLIKVKEIYQNHGWTNVNKSKVEPCDDYINGCWVLRLPQPKLIKYTKIINLNNKEND